MNGQQRIEEMFAFVCVDDDGTEGIPAIQVGGMAMPLVGADMKRVESLRPIANEMARSGKKITIVKFTNRIELEVIE